MILIVGLGNPGKKFEKTRHSLGRLVVGSWQKVAGFPNFKFEKKFNALISRGVFNKKKMVLALPETFMNNSGESVKILTETYNLEPKNLIVVHDDLDLPLGKIRIVKNRGAAGHKGVQSIIDELKTKGFIRIRVGIGNQKIENRKQKIEDLVLQKFNKEEEKTLKEVVKKAVKAVETILMEGLEKAMSEFNT